VLGTAVPETPVDEYRDSGSYEYDVSCSPKPLDGTSVKPEPQTH
jgi:hypothetical protein